MLNSIVKELAARLASGPRIRGGRQPRPKPTAPARLPCTLWDASLAEQFLILPTDPGVVKRSSQIFRRPPPASGLSTSRPDGAQSLHPKGHRRTRESSDSLPLACCPTSRRPDIPKCAMLSSIRAGIRSMSNLKIGTLAVGLTVLSLASPREALAYVDPATGSIILQVVLGLIFTASITFRRFWRNALASFAKLFSHGRKRHSEPEQ